LLRLCGAKENDHERIMGCSPEKAWKRREDLKHMRKLRNPKLEIFARELAAGKTPEQAGEIADNFSGKPEPEDEFTERLSEMFSQRMKEFFSLFVDAKTKTYRAVLERIKAGCSTLDPQATGPNKYDSAGCDLR